jgi:glycerol-3-phosphate acyltransferase PlsY
MDLSFFLRLVLSFLIGAIPFAVVAMWGTGIDITQVGSRNPGFNNVLRLGYKRRAAIALLGDVSKGFIALTLLSRAGDSRWALWCLGLAAIFGHCWTPFLRFRGGKGVATTTGVLLFLEWKFALLFPVVYLLLRIYGRRRGWPQEGALASLLALFVVTALIVALRGGVEALFAGVLLAFVVLRHTSNLRQVFLREAVSKPKNGSDNP